MAKEIDVVEQVRLTIDNVREFGEGRDNDFGTAAAVIREARDAIAEARTAGVDVSYLGSQLPELEQKAKRFHADNTVNRVRRMGEGKNSGYITPDTPIRDARNAIADAKSAGADVSDLERIMPGIEQKAWHSAAKKA